jgi:4-amino-4-deoxy-L-arabinose transferase-like glycosyltransferase
VEAANEADSSPAPTIASPAKTIVLRGRVTELCLLIAVFAAAFPIAQRLAIPYEDNYHGGLTAWFALMSENMTVSGFGESRFMPFLNPEKAEFPNFRWYITHPPLDVVLRAFLMKMFGPDEWAARLQGLIGAFGAVFFFFGVVRRYLGDSGALASACALMSFPLFPRVAHLSMHHPMTFFCGSAALYLFHALRDRPTTAKRVLFFSLLFFGMNFDWPGYFMLPVVWLLNLFSGAKRDRGLIWQLPVLAVVGIGFFYAHVAWVGQDLWAALRSASQNPGRPLTLSEWFSSCHAHLRAAVTPAFAAANILASLALFASKKLRAKGSAMLWLSLLLYGSFNYIAFPGKAPFEDFWGFYFLPLGAFSVGIVVDSIDDLLVRAIGVKFILPLAGVLIGLAAATAWIAPRDLAAEKRGAKTKELVGEWIKAIPPEDRGIFMANWHDLNGYLLLAYSRVNVLPPLADLRTDNIVDLPARVRRDCRHLKKGTRCLLFIYVDERDPNVGKLGEIVQEFNRYGAKPYRGNLTVLDITDFIWAGS